MTIDLKFMVLRDFQPSTEFDFATRYLELINPEDYMDPNITSSKFFDLYYTSLHSLYQILAHMGPFMDLDQ